MLPARRWVSPNPRSTYDAIAGFQWLVFKSKDPHLAPDASWPSRLAQAKTVLRRVDTGKYYIVLASMSWGCVVWPLQDTPFPSTLTFCDRLPRPLEWLFITDVNNFTCVIFTLEYRCGFGALLVIGGEEGFPRGLLR